MSFSLVKAEKVSSLDLNYEEYSHDQTGARHIHLLMDTDINAFQIAFRTQPKDNSGVAHILEHSVLQGSRKFPVHSAFFKMDQRSFSDNMNAMTGPDYTVYPFQSSKEKDFRNLLQVYLDATFFPILAEDTFRQEGHRLAYSDNPDAKNDLEFKGIVYNEMKAAYGSMYARFFQALCKELFKGSIYSFESGGFPPEIPQLSYQSFIDFHKRFYSPANAHFLYCGKMPASQMHELLEDLVLNDKPAGKKAKLPDRAQKFNAPRSCELKYPYSGEDAENNAVIVLSWILGDGANPQERLEVDFLCRVLFVGGASPLGSILESSNLGDAFISPLFMRDLSFFAGLMSTKVDHADAIEELILDELNRLALEGIDRSNLESVLHGFELEMRSMEDQGGDSFALNLLHQAAEYAILDLDPLEGINRTDRLESIKGKLLDPQWFKTAISEKLLNNPHRLKLSLIADENFVAAEVNAEKDLLKQIAKKFNAADTAALSTLQDLLEKRREDSSNDDKLPEFRLADIDCQSADRQPQKFDIDSLAVNFYSGGTNGICYQRVSYDLSSCDTNELQTIADLRFMTQLGYADLDYQKADLLRRNLGNSPGLSLVINAKAENSSPVATFFMRGNSLVSRFENYSEMLRDTLHSSRFDETNRLRDLLAEDYSHSRINALSHGAIAYLNFAASAAHVSRAEIQHQLFGYAAIVRQKMILNQEDGIARLADSMNAACRRLTSFKPTLSLVAGKESMPGLLDSLGHVWGQNKSFESGPVYTETQKASSKRRVWLSQSAVSYTCMSLPALPYADPDFAALSVLGSILTSRYLLPVIREKHGAYGARAVAGRGVFNFYSWADPRLQGTFIDFKNSLAWIAENEVSKIEIERAILDQLKMIDSIKSPALAASRDLNYRLEGISEDLRNRHRASMIAVKQEDLRRVADTHLDMNNASYAILTGREVYEKENLEGFQVHEI
jgi:presequence protease